MTQPADPNIRRLALWRCHKTVHAAPIVEARVTSRRLIIDGPHGNRIEHKVPEDFFERGVPIKGDYFVLYADNYESWSPKAVFEDGYTQVAAAR